MTKIEFHMTDEQVVRQALEHLSPFPPEHIVKSMRAWLPEALAELDELRADLKDAAGELLVPIPDPGTYMAKLMLANRLLKNERDALMRRIHGLNIEISAAREALVPW